MATTEELYRPGLEGIIAGETTISSVEQSSLAYRGYMIDELAEQSSFEEVAYLLLHGELPGSDELAAFRARMDELRTLPDAVIEVIRRIPKGAPGMDVLRTAVSMAGHFDPAGDDEDEAAQIRRCEHLFAIMPTIIGARLRLLDGKDPLEPKPGLSHAAQTLYLAFGKEPSELEERTLDLTLILYAEHEFNASAFAARVCTSTMSDLYSAIVCGIGTLKGPLHGGANEETIRLINRFKNADEARAWTEEAINTKAKIMGFGHRVYKNGDHRAKILEDFMRDLAGQRNERSRLDVYDAIKNTVWDRKQIHMNLDYPCGLVYYLMGLPIDIYTPLFVASRVTGWCAHCLEQWRNNRIIRPRSRYTGPAVRKYVPIEKR